MTFLYPSYLWALFGLLIPIAIHLWSKKEGRTVKIGSIKLLDEADSKQSRSIKLNELLLLLLRLSIIGIIVLIMAEPQIKGKANNSDLTYIVEASLLNSPDIQSLIENKSEFSFRLLEKGFPELSDTQINDLELQIPNYWQLAKEMESIKSDSIIVLTNAFKKGIKGKRPTISKNIEWILFEPENPKEQIIEVIQIDNKYRLLSVLSNSKSTSFKKTYIPLNSNSIVFNSAKDSARFQFDREKRWYKIKSNDTIQINLFFDDTRQNELNFLEASFATISDYLERPIIIEKFQDSALINLDSKKPLVWLSDKNPVKTNGKLLTFKANRLAKTLFEDGDADGDMLLSKTLTIENSVMERLSEQLILFLDFNVELKNDIYNNDKMRMDKASLIPNLKLKLIEDKDTNLVAISKWFWVLLAFFLLTERVVANYRKQ